MFVPKQVIIMTQNVKFSIAAKEALESTGEYEVFTFTSARGVVDHLGENRGDVLFADFRVQDMTGRDLMDNVRTLQPDIAVIGSPEHPSMDEIAQRYNMQAVVSVPYSLRRLPRLLNDAIDNMAASQSTPVPTHTMVVVAEDEEEPIPESPRNKTLEFWVSENEDGSTKVEFIPIEVDPETGAYRVLAQEEPPMPKSLEEGATVSDLRQELEADVDSHRVVNVQQSPIIEDEAVADSSDIIPAALVLEAVVNESTPVEKFSLSAFLRSVEKNNDFGQPQIKPLKSWIEESQKYIREPDFLPDNLPGYSQQLEYTASVTIPSASQERDVEQLDASELMTDPMQPVQRSRPLRSSDSVPTPPAPPEMPERRQPKVSADLPQQQVIGEDDEPTQAPPIDEVALDEAAIEQSFVQEPIEVEPVEVDTAQEDIVDTPTQPDSIADEEIVMDNRPPQSLPEEIPDSRQMTPPPQVIEKPQPKPVRYLPFTHVEATDDPKLAQLAVTLTQVSLELTAEATLLAKNGLIVAYAGQLPKEDVDELREEIGLDWTSNGDKSRIRFVTLAASGTDYMLYTRHTDAGYALSMIFSGRMSLSSIRRQGKRLAEALANLPQPQKQVEEVDTPVYLPIEFPTPDEINDYAPHTFIWLLRDPSARLTGTMQQLLASGLDKLLHEAKWKIHDMDIRDSYIYLYADMPDSLDPHSIIRDLVRVSGTLLERAGHTLDWDDAYLVLQPGREMSDMEIQRFIDFVRG